MPAKTQSPLQVAQAAFDAVAKRDTEAITAYDSEETVEDFVAGATLIGATAIKAFFDETFSAFPDFNMVVDRMICEGEVVVTQWHATGTFTGGTYQGVEPTGKFVEIRGVDVMEITDGKIVRNTIYYDGLSMARQMGLLPKEGSGADKAMMTVFNTVTKLRQRAGAR